MLVRLYRQPYLLSTLELLYSFLIKFFFQELTPLAEGGGILQSDEEEMGK